MTKEAMKADDQAPDFRKAMLYHSDRADAFMAERDAALARIAELEAALPRAYVRGRDDAARQVWSEHDEKDVGQWGRSPADIARQERARLVRALPVPADLGKGVAINWRDDPSAIVEDYEPQVGRDYA